MAPCIKSAKKVPSDSSDENTAVEDNVLRPQDLRPDCSPNEDIKMEIVWFNVYNMSVLHLLAFYGYYLGLFHCSWYTIAFSGLLYLLGGLGITAGAHRLWAHKSYKAKPALRTFLMLCQTLAGQDDLYKWSRDHRVHHKWSETNADPYNANRGMFFSHVGWLLIKKHPDVVTYGNKLSYEDLLADPIVQFQRKYYFPLFWAICAAMPTVVPWMCWGEGAFTAFCVAGTARYVFTLHMTWLVNSLAHYYGVRPYDSGINPAENMLVSLGAIGEGFHNFHHSFPYDYQSSEMGWSINITTMFIDLMYVCGQAYDLRTVSANAINSKKERTGDASGARKFFRPNYGKGKVL